MADNNLNQQVRKQAKSGAGAVQSAAGGVSAPQGNLYAEAARSATGGAQGGTGTSGGSQGNLYAAAAQAAPISTGNSGVGSGSGKVLSTGSGTAQTFPGGTRPGNVTYVEGDERKTGTTAPSQGGYYDTMRDYYDSMYNSQVAANNQALANAQQRAREAAQAQQEALTAGYQGTNRQLYRDYMDNQKKLPQQMAAQGYNGGLTESSRLRLSNAYEEALADNERARLSQEANVNQTLAQQLYEAQAAADSANQQAAQNRYGYLAALQEAEHQENQANAKDKAAMLAGMGDYSGYADLGYSQEQIDALGREWNRNNRLEQQAANLAQAGDFSGYLALGYTQDQVDAMQRNWDRTNRLEQQAANLAQAGDFSGYLALGYTQDQVDAMQRNWDRNNRLEQQAATLAQSGDFSGYLDLGYTQDQVDAMKRYWDRNNGLEQQAATLATAGDFSMYLDLGYTQDQVDALTRAWLAQNEGLQDAWVKAHPEDAKRLGLAGGINGTTGGGGVYTPAKDTKKDAEKDAAKDDFNYVFYAENLYDQGYSATDIRQQIEQDYKDGKISQSIRDAAVAGVGDKDKWQAQSSSAAKYAEQKRADAKDNLYEAQMEYLKRPEDPTLKNAYEAARREYESAQQKYNAANKRVQNK